jgi:hypothetical protein
MRQVGIVVRDIESAMKYWVEVCGLGPWFYTDRLVLTAFTYNGTRYDDPHVSIALANSGEVQLELIQQRCNTPGMYQEFLTAGREGMQHWSSWPQEGPPGTVIEMADATPARMRIFDAVRAAAADWDGADPIRRQWPT